MMVESPRNEKVSLPNGVKDVDGKILDLQRRLRRLVQVKNGASSSNRVTLA